MDRAAGVCHESICKAMVNPDWRLGYIPLGQLARLFWPPFV